MKRKNVIQSSNYCCVFSNQLFADLIDSFAGTDWLSRKCANILQLFYECKWPTKFPSHKTSSAEVAQPILRCIFGPEIQGLKNWTYASAEQIIYVTLFYHGTFRLNNNNEFQHWMLHKSSILLFNTISEIYFLYGVMFVFSLLIKHDVLGTYSF